MLSIATLKVTGQDAAEFLQGQLTNDVRDLADGGSAATSRPMRVASVPDRSSSMWPPSRPDR